MQQPTKTHFQRAKRVLRYLKGIKDMGLHIKPCQRKLSLQAFSNTDQAFSKDDKRSIVGYCVYLGDTLISWSSKKQQVMSLLSIEFDYRALARVACEVIWIESLMHELSLNCRMIAITQCDHISVTFLALNPVYHAKTKHIEIYVHFIRDKVLAKQLEMRYVPSQDQVADCLTKPVSYSHIQYLRDKLEVVVRPLPFTSFKESVRT